MRLVSNRRPGTATAFVDSVSEEVLLEFRTDQNGDILVAYRLYDATGAVAGESELQPIAKAFTVRCRNGETLLDVPADPDGHVSYRLYNSSGVLLTFSDGMRTKIYRSLRMEAR